MAHRVARARALNPQGWSRVAVAAALGFALLAGCGRHGRDVTRPEVAGPERAAASSLAQAMEAQDESSVNLMALPGVVGTSLVRSGTAWVLHVYLAVPDVAGIPAVVNGLRVETEVTGEFHALALTDRYRPVPIGVSIGNASECLPGTVSCMLRRGDRTYILCANHVFARRNQAVIGEAIVQPCRLDAAPDCAPALASSTVGVLADFEPLRFDGSPNVIDAAIAEATVSTMASTPPGFYGAPAATPVVAATGMRVQKLGRTTGLTRGTIKGLNTKVKITYPEGKAVMVGQITTSKAFGDFGDSGALVVTDDATRAPVGIVIAGGNNGAAIVTPIGPILARFGAMIVTP